jgi:hypothetical protein
MTIGRNGLNPLKPWDYTSSTNLSQQHLQTAAAQEYPLSKSNKLMEAQLRLLITRARVKHCTMHSSIPPENNIDPNFEYPPPKVSFKNMTDDQIHCAIRKLKLYSAPGPNGISNSVFTHCTDILVPWLGALYRATFCLWYYPKRWQEYITIVLCKPGKPNYSNPKAY